MLPHNHNLNLAQGVVELVRYTEDDVLFSVFPLFHANAKYMTVLAALVSGARAVINRRFSASRFWDICRREGVTAFNGQGEMLRILLKQPESDADRDNTVRVVVGAAAATDLVEQFEQRYDLAVLDAYGMTETGPTIAASWEARRAGAAGLPTPWYEAKVVDADDVEVAPGVTGEIVVRPKLPFVMMERYWGNDAATLDSMRNLWFHTGDNAYRDEDGYFWFVARGTDSIRRRGENVSAWEVERVLADHPELLGGRRLRRAVRARRAGGHGGLRAPPGVRDHRRGAARLLHGQDAALRGAALRPLHGPAARARTRSACSSPSSRRRARTRRASGIVNPSAMSYRGRSDHEPQGKVAVVTGGGAGIGRSIVQRLTADGARVAALDIRLETAQKSIELAGGEGLAVVCDVVRQRLRRRRDRARRGRARPDRHHGQQRGRDRHGPPAPRQAAGRDSARGGAQRGREDAAGRARAADRRGVAADARHPPRRHVLLHARGGVVHGRPAAAASS